MKPYLQNLPFIENLFVWDWNETRFEEFVLDLNEHVRHRNVRFWYDYRREDGPDHKRARSFKTWKHNRRCQWKGR